MSSVDVKVLEDNILSEDPRLYDFGHVLCLVVDKLSCRDANCSKLVQDWQHRQALELTNGVELLQGVLLCLWNKKVYQHPSYKI